MGGIAGMLLMLGGIGLEYPRFLAITVLVVGLWLATRPKYPLSVPEPRAVRRRRLRAAARRQKRKTSQGALAKQEEKRREKSARARVGPHWMRVPFKRSGPAYRPD